MDSSKPTLLLLSKVPSLCYYWPVERSGPTPEFVDVLAFLFLDRGVIDTRSIYFVLVLSYELLLYEVYIYCPVSQHLAVYAISPSIDFLCTEFCMQRVKGHAILYLDAH
ncbi:hypothetical protein H257_13894 [Aphanomyces astaci]|uniref:Uncharacterized protein n=1 Tax=Aphanomyces astaci TaxID=112090 RepID=W4FSK8_APHAT|nr:hypothetical protein H257_13894 [Aphanomyces astaci]ETV70500.1 hypothetical protein H257_13894 [Aphanomyces astaci]|eukprot:XP_009839883.1 hypothetical protein H257_13894 [Aphanomyces astaci]